MILLEHKSDISSGRFHTLDFIACVLQIILTTVTYIFFFVFLDFNINASSSFIINSLILPGAYTVILTLILRAAKAYFFSSKKIINLLSSQYLSLFSTNFIFYILHCLMTESIVNPLPIILTFLCGIVIATLISVVIKKIVNIKTPVRNTVLLYGRDSAVALKIKLDNQKNKLRVSKIVPESVGFEKMTDIIKNFDAVIINDLSAAARNEVLKFCYKNRIPVYIAPKITDIIARSAQEIHGVDTPLLLIDKFGLSSTEKFFKRAMDICLSLAALIGTSPILLLIALFIKIEDGGPVFYKQKRATLGEKEFDILKFRSMIVDAEKEGFSIPATGLDPRITKVGRIIRPLRLDELPQIINILKGDMSIVGPRPERLEHVIKYSEDIPEFVFRLNVKGGLTGYAQIYGKYNTTAYDKLRLDLIYIQNYSLLMDIKLIFLTVPVLFSKESTEGFDVAEEIDKLKSEVIDATNEEASEN